MNRTRFASLKLAIAVAVSLLWSAQLVFAAPAKPKVWTVEARQEQLMKDINQAQKAKELTDKEANKLRKQLAGVARKKAKDKRKNNNAVTSETKDDLQEKLTEISDEIKKLKQEKLDEKAAGKAAK